MLTKEMGECPFTNICVTRRKRRARAEALDGARKAEVTYHHHAERTVRDPDLGVRHRPGMVGDY